MSTLSLDRIPHLKPEEKEYITIDVSRTMEAISFTLDIVEVARKLGIQLRKLPKNSKYLKGNSLSGAVYISDCPKHEDRKGVKMLFSTSNQVYGCFYTEDSLSHNFDAWNFFYYCREEGRDIYKLLSYCNPSEYRYEDPLKNGTDADTQINIRKIHKLLELFPQELAPVIEANPFRYIYNTDYFALDERYHPGIHDEIAQAEESRIGGRLSQDAMMRIGEQIHLLKRIVYTHEIVQKIHAKQAEIDRIIYGKSLSEVLGDAAIDELTEINHMAQEEGEVAEILRTGDTEDVKNEWLTHFAREEDENRGTIEAEKKAFEIDTIEGRARLAREQAEQARLEAEEIARIAAEEAQRMRAQELARAKRENPVALFSELLENRQQQASFFEGKTYDATLEGDTPLEIGDFGKLVLVLQKDTSAFSIVFGKHKANFAPPTTIEEAECITTTRNIPEGSGVRNHKNITMPIGAQRVGGAQYIVLPDNTILIGGDSGDYGSLNQEITEKCLKTLGYTVYFLGNTSYKTLGGVYEFLNRK